MLNKHAERNKKRKKVYTKNHQNVLPKDFTKYYYYHRVVSVSQQNYCQLNHKNNKPYKHKGQESHPVIQHTHTLMQKLI